MEEFINNKDSDFSEKSNNDQGFKLFAKTQRLLQNKNKDQPEEETSVGVTIGIVFGVIFGIILFLVLIWALLTCHYWFQRKLNK